MAEVPLTTFTDFVSKTSSAKFTVVKNFEGEYDMIADFYKPLREAIVKMHKDGEQISVLARITSEQDDEKKRKSYPAVIAGYKRWRGRKKLEWFKPQSKDWSHAGLIIRVNPELGLKINTDPHLIKLYFKPEKLRKAGADLITHLMSTVLSERAPVGCKMAVLDIRSSKLFVAGAPTDELTFLLRGEASYWMSVWNDLHPEAKK